MHDFTISLSTMGSQIISRFVKLLPVLHLRMMLVFSSSFLPSGLVLTVEECRSPVTAACHMTATNTSSWFECRLYGPVLLGEIGGNDQADGARDITNPIMNSLSFGLDTLFLFISWYLSLLCMHFVFITVAHVKAERESGSMNMLNLLSDCV